MINIVFMATPEIAVKSLQKLIENPNYNVLAVVTQPDRPKGRGNKMTPPPVKECAIKNNVECFQTEKLSRDTELIQKIKALSPDFFVTFAFGQILSQEVLDIPRYATVNLHASLLPKYRGANPIQRCIYNGDKVTGITTMLTVLELDAGDICETCKIDISDNMTDIELKDIISQKSPDLICSTLKGLYEKTLKPIKQDCSQVSTANKFTKQDGLISWDKSSSLIHNQVRSMLDFPTSYTFFNNKSVKIIETVVVDNSSLGNPSEITDVLKDGIIIQTGQGKIKITKVKPESKGIMNAFDFANGAKLKVGMKFGE